MPKHPGGRPTTYTLEFGTKICALIAQGHSLRKLREIDPKMPSPYCILDWASKYPEFAQQYARAMDMRTDHLAEEALEISDNSTYDWIEQHDKRGTRILGDHEHVNRSRLRVDTRKWLISKMNPKKYGDKVQDVNVNLSLNDLIKESIKKPGDDKG